MAYFHTLVGMVATASEWQASACPVKLMNERLQIEPDRHDTLYNLANLIKDDQPEEAD